MAKEYNDVVKIAFEEVEGLLNGLSDHHMLKRFSNNAGGLVGNPSDKKSAN